MKPAYLIALACLLPTVAALPAQAQGTPEQRAACEGDAFKFCGKDIPDPVKIEACLRTHLPEISPACRAQFDERKK
ncbi:MAG TPA: hypothetical protein PKA55_18500 [Rhodoblastus sp.]|nr:hypothetical protein [Rhodoblastus sp.]